MVHRHSCKRKSSKYFKVVNFNACFLWPHLSPSLHPISERLTSKERLSQNCFQSVLSLIKHHLQWWYEEKHWAPTLQHVLIILSVQQFLSFYSSKYRCCFSNKICFKSSITTFQKKNKTKQSKKKKWSKSWYYGIAEEFFIVQFCLANLLVMSYFHWQLRKEKSRAEPVLW